MTIDDSFILRGSTSVASGIEAFPEGKGVEEPFADVMNYLSVSLAVVLFFSFMIMLIRKVT